MNELTHSYYGMCMCEPPPGPELTILTTTVHRGRSLCVHLYKFTNPSMTPWRASEEHVKLAGLLSEEDESSKSNCARLAKACTCTCTDTTVPHPQRT